MENLWKGLESLQTRISNPVDLVEEQASSYLPDYSYNIFTFFYDITFYPLVMSVPGEIGTEVELIMGQ